MEKLELKVISTTGSNSNHVQLFINDDDCGYLYLNDNELESLNRVFRYSQSQFEYEYVDTGKDDESYDKQ